MLPRYNLSMLFITYLYSDNIGLEPIFDCIVNVYMTESKSTILCQLAKPC